MPSNQPEIISIQVSSGGIPKLPVSSVRVLTRGLEGDGHNHDKHNHSNQAVCFQDIEDLEQLGLEGYGLVPGATGENVTVRDLKINALPLGTVLTFDGGVVVELTKVRKPCYVLDAIDPQLKDVIVGRCGMYAKVVTEGVLQPGEKIHVALPSESQS